MAHAVKSLQPTHFQRPSCEETCSEIVDRVDALWRTLVRTVGYFLYFDCGLQCFALSLATWLTEPCAAFEAAWHFPKGWCETFTYEGANPTDLSEAQLSHAPILLLHGNYANPSTFINLISSLKEKTDAPIFTVTLYDDIISDLDHAIIDRKLDEMRELYTSKGVTMPPVTFVGHSRGAELSFHSLLRRPEDIGQVIRIGWPSSPDHLEELPPHLLDRLYEIRAMRDLILQHPSQHPDPTHKSEVDCGHLGLLMHPKVHEQVAHWIGVTP